MDKPRMSRRVALTTALAGVAAAPAAGAADRRAEAEATLRAFLHAFENDDLAAMEGAFAPDAVSFDVVVASPEASSPLARDAVRRKPGMPPVMRRLVQSTPKAASGPPYRKLDPKDLLVQTEGEMALCTFHLELPTSLARRTVVLVRRSGTWKILHIHASNVVTA
ncbi:nuclear transport factor 2 family protein [Phenylobacterium sp.]|uniref:nuclear transport factor 2 family protein n=1 Tax=Phenylobacterium sp. TaxID=1871053 RepID=UPI003D267AC1